MPKPKPTFGAAVVRAARTQLGVHEHPLGSNAGPGLKKYYAVGWGGAPNPYGWCTWFAAWCWQEGLKATGSKVRLGSQLHDVYMPRTAAVYQAAAAHHAHLLLIPRLRAKPGDWVCMGFDRQFQHSGIFVRWIVKGLISQHIEGNTSGTWRGSQQNGGGVYLKRRLRLNVHAFVRYIP